LSLYTTRIVLEALGAESFGLYNVIAGLVAMLSFLNAAMTTSTLRYISVNIGTKNIANVKKVFANSVIMHFGLGVLIVLILEGVGIYFLHNLRIPPDKLQEATILFHFVVLTTFVTIISVPYDAILNAHENMAFLAVSNVIDTVLRLATAFLLMYIADYKLAVYGFLGMIVTLIIRVMKSIYVRRRYEETKVNYRKLYDKGTIKELSFFASWNLFGVLSYLGRTQGLAVLINVFFGALINAAYAISNQVVGQINFFTFTLLQAINPQIMKNEGSENRDKMLSLSYSASKFGFMLFAIVAIPALFEMDSILAIWLKKVPDYSGVICKFVLVSVMINQITVGIDSAMQASGRIKKYMLAVGSVKLAILPVSYILLKFGASLDSIFYGYIILEVVTGITRMMILKADMGVSLLFYFNKVILRMMYVVAIVVAVDYLFVTFLQFRYRLLFTVSCSTIVFAVASYYLALNADEKGFVKKIIAKFGSKAKKNQAI
jgi:O-antigen/teichoic acid export membrane protein